MTNDIQTPAAAQPDRAFITLCDEIRSSEDQVADACKWLHSTVNDVNRALDAGSSMNSLGEVQAQGNRLDVAVSKLESQVQTLRALIAFGVHRLVVDETEVEWLRYSVGKSARLQAEFARVGVTP